MDIWLTRDEELAVFHDRKLVRLTGTRHYIDRCSSRQLRQLRFIGYEDTPEIKIPLLQEVFASFGKTMFYNIEIKPHRGSYQKLIVRLRTLIAEYDIASQVWLSSFDVRFLREWGKQDFPVAGALLFSKWNWIVRRQCHQPYIKILHPEITLFPRLAEMLPYAKPLCFWTVNRTEELKNLSDPSIFGIISDNIPLIKEGLSLWKK